MFKMLRLRITMPPAPPGLYACKHTRPRKRARVLKVHCILEVEAIMEVQWIMEVQCVIEVHKLQSSNSSRVHIACMPTMCAPQQGPPRAGFNVGVKPSQAFLTAGKRRTG